MSSEEWDLRVQLAACYRIFDYLGWVELIFNHISMRIPGPEHHFLINPYGLWYKEITASNLVKIDLDGNIVGDSDYQVNKAGFIIHSAIHAARENALCVMHTHTTATLAVACQEDGLRTDNFYSTFLHGDIAYHDFHGLTVYPEEQKQLVESLGDKNLMLLRNHGSLTVGSTIPEALMRMWTLQRACEVQLAAHANGAAVIPVTPQAIRASQEGANDGMEQPVSTDQMVFDALIREIDKIDPSYKS
jgi:ribulose-5-phosphate 4-epimerase/fuculose-1-phosphate aldolase